MNDSQKYKKRGERNIKKSYGIRFISIIMVFLSMVVGTLVSNLLTFKQLEKIDAITSVGMDGIFVWAQSRFLIIGIMPVVLITFLSIVFSYSDNSIIVIRSKNRRNIYFKEIKMIVFFSMAALCIAMMVSFISSSVFHDGVIWHKDMVNDENCKTYLAMSIEKGYCNKDFNVFGAIMRSYGINTLELIIALTISDMIYYLLDSRMVSMVFTYVYSSILGIFPKFNQYAYLFGIKVSADSYYHEAANIGYGCKVLFILVLIEGFIIIVTSYFANKKDYIK